MSLIIASIKQAREMLKGMKIFPHSEEAELLDELEKLEAEVKARRKEVGVWENKGTLSETSIKARPYCNKGKTFWKVSVVGPSMMPTSVLGRFCRKFLDEIKGE